MWETIIYMIEHKSDVSDPFRTTGCRLNCLCFIESWTSYWMWAAVPVLAESSYSFLRNHRYFSLLKEFISLSVRTSIEFPKSIFNYSNSFLIRNNLWTRFKALANIAPKSRPNGGDDVISRRNNWIEYRLNVGMATCNEKQINWGDEYLNLIKFHLKFTILE